MRFMIATLIALAVSPASANDDLLLDNQRIVSLDRRIVVQVVDSLPDGIYAQAQGAYIEGNVCVIRIRKDRLEYLFHEIQHCAGHRHG